MTSPLSITKSLDGEEATANGKQSDSLEIVGSASVSVRQVYSVPESWGQLVLCQPESTA